MANAFPLREDQPAAAVFDFGQGAEAVILQLKDPVWRWELPPPIERHGHERHDEKYKCSQSYAPAVLTA